MDPHGDSSPSVPEVREAAVLLADPRLTAVGLLVEASTGIFQSFERGLAEHGVSGPAFEVLVRLARSPDQRLRMSELALQSTLTNSGLTRLVDRLERAELVGREPCETDRRGFYATLTDDGLHKVLALLPAHLDSVERTFTGVLEPRELDAFLATLRKLRAVVRPTSDPMRAREAADRLT